ncbi:copper resistance protein CopC [Bacillus nakamurai]|uniref:Copper transporter n=1 Tax=Bacillus nakamurai TaxID=1793963 RepID=A0A150F3W9_9BACI|nr:copper resistance protein CopC [Bacillus nakamurai]KXZ15665.1 copper transporter [Bacillus nakamurai]MED1229139.1 copper resistance protein CopC [Bacillus nakamurai]
MRRNKLWLILLLFLVLFPKTSFAHAYITSSTPGENSELKQAPKQVDIQFNEPIEEGFHSIKVYNSSGERVDTGRTVMKKNDNRIMTAALQKNLPHDIYRAEWNAVSADGHPVSGIIPFSVGKADGAFQDKTASGTSLHPETAIDRGILYTALSLFIGTTFFHLFWYRANEGLSGELARRTVKLFIISLSLLGLALICQLPIQTKENAGGAWSAAFQPGYIKETILQTAGGSIWIIQISLYALLVLSMIPVLKKKQFRSFTYWTAPLLFFFGSLLAKAFAGHAAVIEERAVGITMDFLHLSAASVWTGGMAALVLLLSAEWRKSDKSAAWETVKRFSPWAFSAVGVLLFSGVLNGFFIIRSFDSLFHTAYGKTLLIKIGLFVVMLALGGLHVWITKYRQTRSISRTIKAEWVIGIAVLFITAVFTSLPSPPAPAPEPFNGSEMIGRGQTLSISISPNQPGKNEFEVRVTDHNGRLVKDIQQFTVTVYQTGFSGNKNESTFDLKKTKQGVFEADNLSITEKGNWKIKVHGLTSDFNEINQIFTTTN